MTVATHYIINQNAGGSIVFRTTNDGTTFTDALTIDGYGMSLPKFAAGTVSAPGFAFSSSGSTNTGLYLVATDSLGFSANGVSAGNYSSTSAWTLGPSAGAVTHNINGSVNFNTTESSLPAVGLYRSAANTLAFSTSSANVATVSSAGVWTLGPTAATNTPHLIYGGQILKQVTGKAETAALRFEVKDTTPASPASTAEIKMYMKGTKIIFQYNDGGTVRYKYLDMSGTGVTWVHTTTAP